METTRDVTAGTVIMVHQHSVGGPQRLAEVLEVIGNQEHRRYRVRWEDGHESIFFPGSDAVIETVSPTRGRSR